MKIFSSNQIRHIDEYTIINEPVASVDLMERASGKLFNWYIEHFEKVRPVIIFAGPGNNGGDGLAMARMLFGKGFSVTVYFAGSPEHASADWKINRSRLETETKVIFETISASEFRKSNLLIRFRRGDMGMTKHFLYGLQIRPTI